MSKSDVLHNLGPGSPDSEDLRSHGRYIRPNDAAKKLGIGRSSLWHKIKHDPEFPRPVKLGPKTTVLSEADLDAYVRRKAGILSTD